MNKKLSSYMEKKEATAINYQQFVKICKHRFKNIYIFNGACSDEQDFETGTCCPSKYFFFMEIINMK